MIYINIITHIKRKKNTLVGEGQGFSQSRALAQDLCRYWHRYVVTVSHESTTTIVLFFFNIASGVLRPQPPLNFCHSNYLLPSTSFIVFLHNGDHWINDIKDAKHISCSSFYVGIAHNKHNLKSI